MFSVCKPTKRNPSFCSCSLWLVTFTQHQTKLKLPPFFLQTTFKWICSFSFITNPLRSTPHRIPSFTKSQSNLSFFSTSFSKVALSPTSISDAHSSSSSTSLLGTARKLLQEPHLLLYLTKLKKRALELPLLLQQETDPSLLAKWNKELKEILPITELYEKYCKAEKTLVDLATYFDDPELRQLANQDYIKQEQELHHVSQRLLQCLIPPQLEDQANCAVLEMRAGVGGNEATLFAKQLYTMYSNYAHYQGWQFVDTHLSVSETGGYKEATATISGPNVFRKLKFESGVHRVQRVPETENLGRMHTSAVTVALLPFTEEIKSIDIPWSDLRIDVFRASGPGGQHVNKTESAVRLTHLPTGLQISVQDERSQHRNKEKAFKLLKTKLLIQQQHLQRQSRSHAKKQQMGMGDRSERIRTYHFPQNRVTDHRGPVTIHSIDTFLQGNDKLSDLIDALLLQEDLTRLAKLGEQSDSETDLN